jgi:hypothetical protein
MISAGNALAPEPGTERTPPFGGVRLSSALSVSRFSKPPALPAVMIIYSSFSREKDEDKEFDPS